MVYIRVIAHPFSLFRRMVYIRPYSDPHNSRTDLLRADGWPLPDLKYSVSLSFCQARI